MDVYFNLLERAKDDQDIKDFLEMYHQEIIKHRETVKMLSKTLELLSQKPLVVMEGSLPINPSKY